jgi:cytochrome c peroxidase
LTPDKPALDPESIALGHLLFFDPVLSRDGDLSCAHCHDPRLGLADGMVISRGRGGKLLQRNAPPVWNMTFKRHFFWDGRVASLEDQALVPMYHQDEFANAPGEAAARVGAIAEYAARFSRVFGKAPLDDRMIAVAISDFQRSLVSLGSRYDRYALGDHAALSPDETEGLNVFRSFVSRCPECHTPPLFSNGQHAVIGAPRGNDPEFAPFLVPSLRNVNRTAPYMHSGGIATLADVLRFYDRGGGRGSLAGEAHRLHWHIRPLGLSDRQKEVVVTFLEALTDESALPKVPQSVPSGLPILKGIH